LGRSAFISRREGRYVFQIRTPPCLSSAYRSGSIRLALGTANYQMASTRAARIASWILRIRTMDGDPRQAMLELWPRLQALALEPVRDESDYIERKAFQGIAFEVQFLVRHSGAKPNEIVPGWDAHFVLLIRENGRAGIKIEKNNSLEGRIERRREELFALGCDLVVPPVGAVTKRPAQALESPATSGSSEKIQKPGRLSEALESFLRLRKGEDGDDGAKNDVAPIVQFAIDLWKDPWIAAIGPKQIVQLKQAMPEVPTAEGLPARERSLFRRWSIAKEKNYLIENADGEKVKLKRVSQSTLNKRYRTGLNVFWTFLIGNSYVAGPAPNFSSKSKHNRPAVERDAFEEEELLKFLSTPLFTGCRSISRIWIVGEFFCQTFFYWAVLIQLLCGLRPGEIAQFRCADIAELYGEWHFRFAKRSLAAGDDDENDDDEADTEPGGNNAKTKNAFRWIPIHPLLGQLGLLARRDAIVVDYIARRTLEEGGKDRLSQAIFEKINEEAQQQWLFPDWKVYILPSGEIRWSQAVSKSWQYARDKFHMTRKGLALYSARHTFKGFIDDIKTLSERSRRIVMGHATATDTPGGYGPKTITEEQAGVILQLSNRTIERMAKILLDAKARSERGELRVVDAWRNDERSADGRLQTALEKRAEQYR
jgi:integrase